MYTLKDGSVVVSVPEGYTGSATDSLGQKTYYLKGDPHRTNGPAVILLNGNTYWFLYGGFHRSNGPAIERANSGDEDYCLEFHYLKVGTKVILVSLL